MSNVNNYILSTGQSLSMASRARLGGEAADSLQLAILTQLAKKPEKQPSSDPLSAL